MSNQLNIFGVILLITTVVTLGATIFSKQWLWSIRLHFFWSNPLTPLKKLMPELTLTLQDRLENVQFMLLHEWQDDGVKAIVPFFAITSSWHDRREELASICRKLIKVNHDGRFNYVISNLQILHDSLRRAGRDITIGNGTLVGEEVTEKNVYLGHVFGEEAEKTVAFWKTQKDQPKGGWGFPKMNHLNPYDVVSLQAKDFINSWTKAMGEVISELEFACQDPQLTRKFILSRS